MKGFTDCCFYLTMNISAPGMEDHRDTMRASAKKKEGQRHALPPQIFNGEKYCGVRHSAMSFVVNGCKERFLPCRIMTISMLPMKMMN